MLGIGATSAIYSLVDQVLLHALPVRDAGQLVLFDWEGEDASNGFGSWDLLSYPVCRQLNQQKQFFDGVFCRALTRVDASTGGDYHPAIAEIVSGNYFSVLGIGAARGQVITNDDDRTLNANPVAVVSYDFWKTELGGVADVVGRKLLINRNEFRVIGVASSNFKGIDVGTVTAIWIPASMVNAAMPGSGELLNQRTRWVQALGRLRPDVTIQEARVGLQPWFKSMLREDERRPDFPGIPITAKQRQDYLKSWLKLTPAPQGHSSLKRRFVTPLWVLFSVTAVLLGLACLNVSGLFLARGAAREREIDTRLALGASSGRLSRQFIADGLLIALAGGVLGVALAPLALGGLMTFVSVDSARTALHASIDTRLLLFAFGVTILVGILSGLAPAWQAKRRSFAASLQQRGGTAFGGVRLRKTIVTAQIALTLTLVVGATLFVRTLDALMTKGPGFVTSSLVSFQVDPSLVGYSPEQAESLMHRVDQGIQQDPLVQSWTAVRFEFLTGGSWNNPMTILAGKRMNTDRDVNLNAVTPGFFETMGIRLIAGRKFNEHDVRPAGAKPEYRSAIVNQSFVKRYLQGQNPLGVLIAEGAGPDVKPKIQIVGVMSDFNYRGLRDDSEQVVYPYLEDNYAGGTFYVRVRGTPEASFQSLRAIVRRVDPNLPMTDLRTVDQQVARSLNTEHMLATVSSGFGAAALALSIVGLFGVMSFVVTARTREIGIRLALGAKRWSAVWLVLRDALAMLAVGIAIGLGFVWALGRWVQTELYDVKPSDPLVILAAVVILCGAGLAATLMPAQRASGVNPAASLRVE